MFSEILEVFGNLHDLEVVGSNQITGQKEIEITYFDSSFWEIETDVYTSILNEMKTGNKLKEYYVKE